MRDAVVALDVNASLSAECKHDLLEEVVFSLSKLSQGNEVVDVARFACTEDCVLFSA